MARLDSAPLVQTTPLDHLQPGVSRSTLEPDQDGLIVVDDLTYGMMNQLPRSQIPRGSGRVVKNGRVRDDWTGRREGTDEVGTKPDSNRVIGVFSLVQESGNKLVIRVTQSTVHVWDGSNWIAYTVNSPGFRGGALRVSASQLFGKVYLSFNNADSLWEIDFSAREVSAVTEGKRGKFSITFAERIIVANIYEAIGGPRPNKVAWPVNSDPLDWDGTGSGEEDLIATDLGNPITGFVALEDIAVIVRRESIVHISRQPFETAPFRFKTVVHGFGSDLPYTTVRVPGGLMYADSKTREIYFYRPGSLPRPLGAALNRQLFADLANAQMSEATFDFNENEYILGLVWTTDDELLSRKWIVNLSKGRPIFSYDDGPDVTTLGVVVPPQDGTSINELTGTINALTGSIDGLSTRVPLLPKLCAGTATGEIIDYSYDYATDWDSTAFEFEFQTPNVGSISHRSMFKSIEVGCEIPNTGSVTIEQSRNESTWTNTKTASYTGATGITKVRLPKTLLSGNDLYWRVRSTAQQFRIKHWWAMVMQKGLQMGSQQ